MVLAHVAVCNAVNFFGNTSLGVKLNSYCLSEQPFYGNYLTLDSHTNTVISHGVAYS